MSLSRTRFFQVSIRILESAAVSKCKTKGNNTWKKYIVLLNTEFTMNKTDSDHFERCRPSCSYTWNIDTFFFFLLWSCNTFWNCRWLGMGYINSLQASCLLNALTSYIPSPTKMAIKGSTKLSKSFRFLSLTPVFSFQGEILHQELLH